MKRVLIAIIALAAIGLGIYSLRGESPAPEIAPQVIENRPFEIPTGYTARSVVDDLGETVFFEKDGKLGTGFQMLVSAYDEPATEFTAKRIMADLPDMPMEETREFEIPDGRGVMFYSDLGREIWFVAGGYLYQITAPRDESEPAEHVAATFKL